MDYRFEIVNTIHTLVAILVALGICFLAYSFTLKGIEEHNKKKELLELQLHNKEWN